MTVLHLNLHRKFFQAILDGTKTTEYRERTDYWEKRLSGKTYSHIKFRNGYLKVAPEMLVELRRIVQTDDCFELHLGQITEQKNTELLRAH